MTPNDRGALSKFTFSGDWTDSKPVTVEVGMTEADLSGALLGPGGATILAAWLQHKVANSHSHQSSLRLIICACHPGQWGIGIGQIARV